eukprot:2969191-Rhodomonas_salina.1
MTDVAAYMSAGVPPDRVFLLDKTSKVKVHGTGQHFQAYTGLLPLLQTLFPISAGAAAHAARSRAAAAVRSGEQHKHAAAPGRAKDGAAEEEEEEGGAGREEEGEFVMLSAAAPREG